MDGDVRRFRMRRGSRLVEGGLALSLGFAGLYGLFALPIPVDIPLPVVIGVKLVILAVGLAGSIVAWRALSGSPSLEVGPSGFVVDGRFRRRVIPWSKVHGHQRGDGMSTFQLAKGRFVVDESNFDPSAGSVSRASADVYHRWCR